MGWHSDNNGSGFDVRNDIKTNGNGGSSDMQPNANELVCERHRIRNSALQALLRQDQGAEALPL